MELVLDNINKSEMKTGSRIHVLSLFIDFIRSDSKDTPYFTIKSEDYVAPDQIYPSLHRLYVSFGDPTEFNFANHYFLNWAHWKEVSTHPMVIPYVENWRSELAAKIKADALQSIIEVSRSGTKDAVTAARYIISGEWAHHLNPDIKTNRGRPSKNRTAEIPVLDDKAIHDDYSRVLNTKLL